MQSPSDDAIMVDLMNQQIMTVKDDWNVNSSAVYSSDSAVVPQNMMEILRRLQEECTEARHQKSIDEKRYQDTYKSLHDELCQLREKGSTKDDQIRNLKNEKHKLNIELQMMKERYLLEVDKVQNGESELQHEMEKKQQHELLIASLHEEKVKLHETMEELVSSMNAKDLENEDLLQQRDKLVNQLVESRRHYKKEKKVLHEMQREKEDTILKMQKEKEALQNEKEELQREKEELQKEKEALPKEINDMILKMQREKDDALQREKAVLTKEIHNLKLSNDHLTLQLNRSIATCEDSEKALRTIKDEIAEGLLHLEKLEKWCRITIRTLYNAALDHENMKTILPLALKELEDHCQQRKEQASSLNSLKHELLKRDDQMECVKLELDNLIQSHEKQVQQLLHKEKSKTAKEISISKSLQLQLEKAHHQIDQLKKQTRQQMKLFGFVEGKLIKFENMKTKQKKYTTTSKKENAISILKYCKQ